MEIIDNITRLLGDDLKRTVTSENIQHYHLGGLPFSFFHPL